MSDVGSDLDAVGEMVYAAQDRLIKKNPSHELVSFMNITYDKEREDVWEALITKFNKDLTRPPKGAMECTWAMARYLIALETELGERPLKNVPPLTPGIQANKVSDFDDDFPF